MMARNITNKLQILSTPIHGDMSQNHKMSKRIIWDISHHQKKMQVIILMHMTVHIPLIKSHHHLSKPLIHLCKFSQPHLPVLHLKILHHLIITQLKAPSKIHTIHSTNHNTYSTIHKIHSIPLKTTSP
ncbi:hypothetical protein AHAS_Ahas11G0212600 [Arachis hypogaea]